MKKKKNRIEDEKFRKKVEARNDLENYIYSMQSSVRSMEKISDNDRSTLEQTINDTLAWLDAESKDATLEQIKLKQKQIEGICAPIITKLYRG